MVRKHVKERRTRVTSKDTVEALKGQEKQSRALYWGAVLCLDFTAPD